MHIDLEDAAAGEPIRSEVCVIGGGIAGLLLARELARSGFNIVLLEAGGLRLEERSQSLYRAKMDRAEHTGTTEGRFRTFGGSSTRWGGQLLSYTEDIFHPVPGAPSQAWPIGPSDLEPYYARVLEIFQVPRLPFEDGLLASLGQERVEFPAGVRLRFSKWAPFPLRNLAGTVGRECLESPNARVYTHANVAELIVEEGSVRAARVLNYQRRELRFEAEQFVVCCGTFESARIMLLSPGIPNPHGQFGRGFGDHVSVPAAVLGKEAKTAVSRKLGPFFADGVLYTPKIEATSELQRDSELLAVMAHFTIEEPEDSGIRAVRNILTSIQRRELRTAVTKNLLPMLRGLGDVVRLTWALKVRKRRGLGSRAVMRLNIDVEQSSSGENTISLSDERDALGLRKALIHWQVGEAEQETVRRFLPVVKRCLESVGVPPLQWNESILSGGPIHLADTYHPYGGLRMGTSAASSAVDTDLKVHGLGNLYIASCAVFPSGGSSNPTFTMMALTLRLADHLRSLRAAK